MSSGPHTSWRPLIAIALSMVMMYVTSFGVNVLIAPIVEDLGTTVSHVQLVIVSASLIAGSLMVTAGKLGDRFGKKKIFLAGVAIYTAGMTTVVLSPNTAVFTAAWGLIWPSGMVLVIPTSIAMIAYFYEGDQRAAAFGIYGAVLAVISAIAPVIVGFLANTLGWRVALSISPIAGALTFLFAMSLPETEKDDTVRVDLPSVGLSVAGFALFLISTTAASQYGWLLEKRPFALFGTELSLRGLSVVPLGYIISFVLLGLFAARGAKLKRAGQTPLLDISTLRNRTFTLGAGVSTSLFLVVAGAIFALSVFFQAGAKFDSLQTALALLPFSIAYALVSFATPGLSRRVEPKWLMAAGCAAAIAMLLVISSRVSTELSTFGLLPDMLALGAAMGLVMAQVTTVTMSRVSPEEMGGASGLSETMKEILGQGFAVALAGSVLFGAVYGSMADSFAVTEGIELQDQERSAIVVELEGVFQEIGEVEEQAWVAELPARTRDAYPAIVKKAAEDGVRTALSVMSLCMGIGLLLAIALPGRGHAEAAPQATDGSAGSSGS